MKHYGKAVRYVLTGIAVALLLAVFGLYCEPQFMLTLANQLWTCF